MSADLTDRKINDEAPARLAAQRRKTGSFLSDVINQGFISIVSNDCHVTGPNSDEF